MKYIDAEKLKAEIEKRLKNTREYINGKGIIFKGPKYYKAQGKESAYDAVLNISDSLQQEQLETEIRSPFTGGKVVILSRQEEVTFRGEKVKILRKYYRCEDTGTEFTDSKLDEDMMWAIFRAYCEKKGMTSFTDIMLKQEQQEVDLEKEISKRLEDGDITDTRFDDYDDSDIERTARHFYVTQERRTNKWK